MIKETEIATNLVNHDHTYHNVSSPRVLKRKLDLVIDELTVTKTKVKVLQRKCRRRNEKITKMDDIIKNLKDNNMISDSCANVLRSNFSGVTLKLVQRMLKTKKNKQNNDKYDPSLRSFALTLQFYSTKAYNYVRDTLGFSLPHLSTVRRWYGGVDGSPGFTKDVFESLKKKAEIAKGEGKEILCSLMMDEMSIKKCMEWTGENIVGCVDLGNGTVEDSPMATEALVMMVVCVNGSWKVPIGYFLIEGLSGQERANIVQESIRMLTDVGIKVVSLTCDGPSSNLSMLKELGVSLNPDDLNTSFPNPSLPSENIYVFLDVCHMIKLLRNGFSHFGQLLNHAGQKIEWKYLEELQKLQEKEGLHLGNKLRSTHMQWKSQKMKVNLAAQTLSSSVGDALTFCKNSLHLPQFRECQPTIEFIYMTDKLFDVLNSRNKFARGMKSALKPENMELVINFLDRAFEYFKSLKDPKGVPLLKTKRKTPIIGFLVAIQSTKALCDLYVGENKPLEYLLTYKLSQDHLELFFCAVRASGRFRNNPTTLNFMSAYKRLLMRHQIKSSNGNVTAQDPTEILTSATTRNIIRKAIADTSGITGDIALARKYDLLDRSPVQYDHDYVDCPSLEGISEYKEAAIGYIAGYVSRMVCKQLSCPECIDALTTTRNERVCPAYALVNVKDRGGLTTASESVVNVCKTTEKFFQKLINNNNNNLFQNPRCISVIAYSVLKETSKTTFTTLSNHMLDCEPENNHIFFLIKAVVHAYCKIRLYHIANDWKTKATANNVRKTLTKLILFKNQ